MFICVQNVIILLCNACKKVDNLSKNIVIYINVSLSLEHNYELHAQSQACRVNEYKFHILEYDEEKICGKFWYCNVLLSQDLSNFYTLTRSK